MNSFNYDNKLVMVDNSGEGSGKSEHRQPGLKVSLCS